MKFKQCNHTNLSKISLTRKTNILHTWTVVPNSKLFIHVHQHIQSENKRSVDHIAHLRNISSSEQTYAKLYDYTSSLMKNLNISPWKRAWHSFEQPLIPFIEGCFVPSILDEIGSVVLEKTKMWKVYRQTDDGR